VIAVADVVNTAEGSISHTAMAWCGRPVGVGDRGAYAQGSPRNLGGPVPSAWESGMGNPVIKPRTQEGALPSPGIESRAQRGTTA
jgi:hypothetical protein